MSIGCSCDRLGAESNINAIAIAAEIKLDKQ
jgi:hypothetical protein